MRKIRTFKDIKKHAGANCQLLLIRLDTGDVDEMPYREVDTCQGAVDALTKLANADILMPLAEVEHNSIAEFINKAIEDANKKLEEAKSALESIEYGEFSVRGFTPQETLELKSILNVEKPQPPIKMREVGWDNRPPLEQSGKVQAPRLRDEAYADENDPVYLRSVAVWEAEMAESDIRVMAYTLMKCVQGCELTDEDIKAELGEEAHPSEPMTEFRLRLDQVGKILTKAISMPVWIQIQEKIISLTGVNPGRVDFTSVGSPLLNLTGGSRLR